MNLEKMAQEKKTTLKSMLNLVHPDEGTIQMFGKDFKQNEESCKQIWVSFYGGIDFYNHKKLKDIAKVSQRSAFYKNWDEAAFQKYLQTFSLDS